VAGRPADAAPVAAGPPGARDSQPRSTRPALVGRDAERTRLGQMLDAACDGHGGLVLLGGEPGVGKTRLASEILEDGRARGMLALSGHTREDETAPFVMATEILEDMVRLLPSAELRLLLGDNASELSRLLPDLRRNFPDIPPPEQLPPEQQRRFLFNSVLAFLARATAAKPMVMLLDDIHWADESSLLLLEHVAPRLPELRLLLIGTYRDAEADMGPAFARSLATLVRQRLAERVAVKQLSLSSVAELLTALAGAHPPATLSEAIHRGTEGNAFFVEEVFRHLSEEGLLFDDEGRWRRDLDVANLDVPEGVRLVTTRRLGRLDPETVKVLATAAAIGLRFELRVAEAASPDPEAVLDAIEEAEAAQLIRPDAGGREARYEFSHALVRQTLLSQLSVARLQRLHLRLADAMESVYGAMAPERATELAYQLQEAGAAAPADRTRHFLRLAGDQARTSAAADEALEYYTKALALTEDLDPVEGAELRFDRGLALRALGDWEAAAIDWHDALPVLESAGKTDLVTRICHDLSYHLSWQNRFTEAAAIAERGLASTSDEASVGRCRVLAALGHASSNSGDFERADLLLGEAVAMAETLGDERLLSGEVLLHRIYLYEHSMQADRWVATGERAITLARRHGRPWDLSSTLGASIIASGITGRFDRVCELADEAEPLAVQEGDTGTICHALIGRALVDYARGDLKAARRALEECVRRFRDAGWPWWSITLALSGSVAMVQGDSTTARAELQEAAGSPLVGSFQGVEGATLLLFLARAEDDRAVALLDELAPRLPEPGRINSVGAWSVLLPWIESAALLGRRESAAALYPLVRQLMSQGAVVMWTHGLVEKAAGIAAAAGDDWEVAERHFESAIQLADDLPVVSEQPETRVGYARMLLDRGCAGDTDRARDLSIEARDAFAASGLSERVMLFERILRECAARR
ncbi:MAG TPA: AAA family ATPase, partial [Longimicrobiaceae bacterium]|nr:AAA family ATPase [Longimicrobiaceae bacterium]